MHTANYKFYQTTLSSFWYKSCGQTDGPAHYASILHAVQITR